MTSGVFNSPVEVFRPVVVDVEDISCYVIESDVKLPRPSFWLGSVRRWWGTAAYVMRSAFHSLESTRGYGLTRR